MQLIDGSGFFTKMRKNLGAKSRELSGADRDKILAEYAAFTDSDNSKIFTTAAFGYWTITLERPLRLNFACPPDRIERTLADRKLQDADHETLRTALGRVGEQIYKNRETFLRDLRIVTQATANSKKQFVESPDLSDAVTEAVIGNQASHNKMADYFFADERIKVESVKLLGTFMHENIHAEAVDARSVRS